MEINSKDNWTISYGEGSNYKKFIDYSKEFLDGTKKALTIPWALPTAFRLIGESKDILGGTPSKSIGKIFGATLSIGTVTCLINSSLPNYFNEISETAGNLSVYSIFITNALSGIYEGTRFGINKLKEKQRKSLESTFKIQ